MIILFLIIFLLPYYYLIIITNGKAHYCWSFWWLSLWSDYASDFIVSIVAVCCSLYDILTTIVFVVHCYMWLIIVSYYFSNYCYCSLLWFMVTMVLVSMLWSFQLLWLLWMSWTFYLFLWFLWFIFKVLSFLFCYYLISWTQLIVLDKRIELNKILIISVLVLILHL